MTAIRRIAATFDADRLDCRARETLRGIAAYADAAGWDLVVDPFALHGDTARWDGLLVPTHKWLRGPLTRAAAPVVCLAWSQIKLDLPRAIENRYEAGRLAALHLVERGYTTFAYVGFSKDIRSSFERLYFRRTLASHGRRMEAARTYVSFTRHQEWWDKVMASLDGWLAGLQPPVGIFVARPGFARALARLAIGRGLRIPDDVGIIAADDDPLVCGLPPALTAIRFDYADLGHRAAALLDRLIAGEPRPAQAVLIAPALVPRRSTDRQALADPVVARALWFIDTHRTEPIAVADVAAAAGIAQRTLARRFRKAGRDSIHHEIANARLEHAKLLLENARAAGQPPPMARTKRGTWAIRIVADGPPDEGRDDAAMAAALRAGGLPYPPPRRGRRAGMRAIALQSGFPSYAALLRAFKRQAATTPIAWKRRSP